MPRSTHLPMSLLTYTSHILFWITPYRESFVQVHQETCTRMCTAHNIWVMSKLEDSPMVWALYCFIQQQVWALQSYIHSRHGHCSPSFNSFCGHRSPPFSIRYGHCLHSVVGVGTQIIIVPQWKSMKTLKSELQLCRKK